MFDNPNEFKRLILENPVLRMEINRQYLDLFDKCAAVGFHQYVAMEFKSELNRKS
jgi:hypothetical protein